MVRSLRLYTTRHSAGIFTRSREGLGKPRTASSGSALMAPSLPHAAKAGLLRVSALPLLLLAPKLHLLVWREFAESQDRPARPIERPRAE